MKKRKGATTDKREMEELSFLHVHEFASWLWSLAEMDVLELTLVLQVSALFHTATLVEITRGGQQQAEQNLHKSLLVTTLHCTCWHSTCIMFSYCNLFSFNRKKRWHYQGKRKMLEFLSSWLCKFEANLVLFGFVEVCFDCTHHILTSLSMLCFKSIKFNLGKMKMISMHPIVECLKHSPVYFPVGAGED